MRRTVKVRLIFDTKLDIGSQDDIVVVRHPAVAHRLHEAGNRKRGTITTRTVVIGRSWTFSTQRWNTSNACRDRLGG